MAKKKLICGLTALLLAGCGLTGLMGCGKQETAAGKTEIEIVSYKKEAVDTFNEIAEKFNERGIKSMHLQENMEIIQERMLLKN